MLHIMVDAYGCRSERQNDLMSIYSIINSVTTELSVKAIMPPALVPYYYGDVKEDDGISAYVILKGGHFTIHTFPERECYFADLLYDGFVSEDKLVSVLKTELPYSDVLVKTTDRRFPISDQCKLNSIDSGTDFGPHYLIRTTGKCDLSMEKIYHFLDELPYEINMDAIQRPSVITDRIFDYEIISGVTVIAQSHIAVHYYINERKAYIDIFSCSFINCDKVVDIVRKKLGIDCESVLISRGSKHAKKLAQRNELVARYDAWKENTK